MIQPAAFAVEPAMKMHGRPDRAVNGTEPLSGRSASQGTELCATAPARAVDPPPSPVPATAVRGDVETIELVPIALTQLRITLFPWTR